MTHPADLPVLDMPIGDESRSSYDQRAYRLAQAALRGRSAISVRQFRQVSGIRSSYIRRSLFRGLAGPGNTALEQTSMAHFLTLIDSQLTEDKHRAAFMALAGGEHHLQQRHFGKLLFSALDLPDHRRRAALCRRLTHSLFAQPAGIAHRTSLDVQAFGHEFSKLAETPSLLNSRQIGWLMGLRRRQPDAHRLFGLLAPHRRHMLLWSAAYCLLCGALFYWQMLNYRTAGADLAIQIARGAAACVNLGSALVLLPMLKGLLTALHRRLPSGWLPFQSLRSLHKLVGYSLLGFSLIHIGGQTAHQAILDHDLAGFLLRTGLGLTGLALLLVILSMVGFARERFYRQPSRYAWFRLSHRLYFVWFGLMLWHSPHFWAWLLAPGALYLLNHVWQAQRKVQPSCLIALEPLAEHVTRVQLQKPPGFHFRAGDYLYLRVPDIDRQQWHPFTLSSAPEADRLTLHIRNAGYWTGELHQLARSSEATALLPVGIEIDGPYSAPSVEALRSEITILVAGGIGITPYASLLQHIALQARQQRMRVKGKLYLYWICRTPDAVSWIRPVLDELANGNAREKVEIRLFCSMVQRDLGDLALQIASEHYHLRHGHDAATGSPYRLRWGRPDWQRELADICEQHPGKRPRLFFCGPAAFATEMQRHCQRQHIPFAQEIF